MGMTGIFYVIVMDIEREFPALPNLTPPPAKADQPLVYIGVISRYRPRIIYRGYQPIMDYLTANTPYRFELRLSKDYNEALQLLLRKEVTAVFLGSYLYVQAHAKFGVVPLLKPLNENLQPVSRAVLIANPQSHIHTITDLAGKRLALPAREAFSSQWLLEYELPRLGLRPEALADVHNFPHHQNVIAQVLNGSFDAGVTREHLVKDLLDHRLRAVLYSDPIPSSPLAVLPEHDLPVIAALKAALLAVNRAGHDRAALTRDWDAEFVHGFIEATDADYAIIRMITGGQAAHE